MCTMWEITIGILHYFLTFDQMINQLIKWSTLSLKEISSCLSYEEPSEKTRKAAVPEGI